VLWHNIKGWQKKVEWKWNLKFFLKKIFTQTCQFFFIEQNEKPFMEKNGLDNGDKWHCVRHFYSTRKLGKIIFGPIIFYALCPEKYVIWVCRVRIALLWDPLLFKSIKCYCFFGKRKQTFWRVIGKKCIWKVVRFLYRCLRHFIFIVRRSNLPCVEVSFESILFKISVCLGI